MGDDEGAAVKIALYIEDGLEQVVLTPDGDTERAILAKLENGPRALSIQRGQFYLCRGGWVRQGSGEDSTIIVLNPPPEPRLEDFTERPISEATGRMVL